jgi:hypothetical protein
MKAASLCSTDRGDWYREEMNQIDSALERIKQHE